MNRLKEKRYALGASQADIAKMAGISRQTYAYIENGRLAACSLDTLKAICEILVVPILDVVGVDYILRIKPQNADEAKAIIRKIEEEYIHDHGKKTNR